MKKKIIVGIAVCTTLAALGYGGLYCQARNFIRSTLSSYGYPNAEIGNVRLYFDGIVVDKITFAKNIYAESVYFKAHPLQVLQGSFSYFGIKKIKIDVGSLENVPSLGFPQGIPFEIGEIDLAFDTPFGDVLTSVKVKQTTPQTAFVNFAGESPYADFRGKGEIILENNHIASINLDFKKIKSKKSKLSLRRADGWIVMHHDKSWNVAAEFGAGYVSFYDIGLSDISMNIAGSFNRPTVTLSGTDKETDQNVSFDWKHGKIAIHSNKEDETFDTTQMEEEEIVDRTRKMIADSAVAAKKYQEKEIKSPEIKTATADQTNEAIKEERKEVLEDSLIEEDASLLKKDFLDLVRGSFFEGFYYTKPLTVLTIACGMDGQQTCWTAKALGGEFGFDPLNIPSYILRLKNYEQASLLKTALEKLSVRSITIEGTGGTARSMVLEGKSADKRPVYIELSISDIN